MAWTLGLAWIWGELFLPKRRKKKPFREKIRVATPAIRRFTSTAPVRDQDRQKPDPAIKNKEYNQEINMIFGSLPAGTGLLAGLHKQVLFSCGEVWGASQICSEPGFINISISRGPLLSRQTAIIVTGPQGYPQSSKSVSPLLAGAQD